MRITNKHRLPRPVVELVSKPFYHTPGRMGVTSLISPPGMYQLRIRHDDEMEEDAIDRVKMTSGSAMHHILEKAAEGDPSIIAETKHTIEMDGWTIVCIGDLYEPTFKKLSDYKTTSVWHVIDGTPEDWIQQLNCNGYIYRQNGIVVEKLEIFAILDHWSRQTAKQGGNYPPRDCKKFIIPLWPDQKVEQFIHKRIALHKAAEKLPDAELPHCTPEDRWQQKTVYAVMKEGRKTSMRNLDTAEEAQLFIQRITDNDLLSIQVRPGSEVRCEEGKWEGHHYCSVREWCSYFQRLQQNKG